MEGGLVIAGLESGLQGSGERYDPCLPDRCFACFSFSPSIGLLVESDESFVPKMLLRGAQSLRPVPYMVT